jgi:hypothetical protein
MELVEEPNLCSIFYTISDQIFVDQPNYEKVAHVSAKTAWGVIRGLESFSQLVYNTKEHGYQVYGLGQPIM